MKNIFTILAVFFFTFSFSQEIKLNKSATKFEKELEISSQNKYDKRTLMYIDIHGWVTSKVRNVDVIEIIKEKVKLK